MEFSVDASGIVAWGRQLGAQAERVVGEELVRSTDANAFRLMGAAIEEAPVDVGNLKNSHYRTPARRVGRGVKAEVGNTADYAKPVHDGRGPVVATYKRALRFVIDGQVIFRKRVGPAAANPWMRRALGRVRPALVAEYRRAQVRAARRLTGA